MAQMNETTVTGNIGRFKERQVLKRRQEIAEYFRLVLCECTMSLTDKFSDEMILKIADQYSHLDDDEDREMFIIQELEGIST